MSLKSTKTNTLIVIGGPTAVGKTAVSIALAKQLKAEIFSADSRQLYSELEIGVARPGKDELQQVRHHLIASHSIHDALNAGSYAEEALQLLDKYYQEHEVAILCGGTGLYIKALCQGLDQLPQADESLREELRALQANEGLQGLQRRYSSLEGTPAVDLNNPQRLIRAIEIASLGGAIEGNEIQRPFTPLYFFLNIERSKLYDRINQRVDQMMDQGLLEEVKALYPYRELKALQTVGYTELFAHLAGECSLEQAIEKIKQHSRNYAKRQITWFKNQGYTELDAEKQPLRQLTELINAD